MVQLKGIKQLGRYSTADWIYLWPASGAENGKLQTNSANGMIIVIKTQH